MRPPPMERPLRPQAPGWPAALRSSPEQHHHHPPAEGEGEPMQRGRARLSPKERQKRLQEGRCFYCGEPGHLVATCTAKKDLVVQFRWSPEADAAFRVLKHRFTPAPILTLPDPRRQFVVEVDASNEGIGAILSQRSEQDGRGPETSSRTHCLVSSTPSLLPRIQKRSSHVHVWLEH